MNFSGHVGGYASVRGRLRYDRFFPGGARWTVQEAAPTAALACGGRGWFNVAP
jgi:hypothetical protein